MCAKIIMVSGGQRSGKSEYAERLTLERCERPVYIATAHIGDEEMERRVAIHRSRRGERWVTVEEPLHPADSERLTRGSVALLDCLTLLATNHFLATDCNATKARDAVIEELERLHTSEADTITVVTNEIGLGGISADAMQRAFTDLQGWVNAYLGKIADEAYLTVSGLPIRLK